ncbi:cyclophilin-like fold protein [Aggregatibacter kilianii]|uniref:cyclophilin-like fold protein n=1 Tax=Aggregatibacter kilianii TaxID=2025884 RepID=UPI000D64955E|nr:cyclophilin-like fold protein [Aggregatibacter kilianii]
MKLKITLDSDVYSATLEENPTSQSFWQLLPLESKLDNYSHNEKIFYPSHKLSAENAPESYAANAGDITYYAPWGNVAMFFEQGEKATGLIYLGKFNGDLTALSQSSRIKFKKDE